MFGISVVSPFAAKTCGHRIGIIANGLKFYLHLFGQWLVHITESEQYNSVGVESIESITSCITAVEVQKTNEESLPILPLKLAEQEVFHEPTENAPLSFDGNAIDELTPAAVCESIISTPDEIATRLTDIDRTVTIVAVCNVLELLERQLAEVNKDVESSVAGVCNGFQGMAARAQAAVNAAADSMNARVGDADGKDLIGDMQNVLTSLINNVRSSSDFTKAVCEKLQGLEARLGAIENTIGEVEELANRAKLVALNGQIEAARLGDAGKAFAVVAKETKTLSTHAASTSDSIRSLVSELSKEIKATTTDIRLRTERDLKSFSSSEIKGKELLTDIDINHKRIVNSLNTTSEISGLLRGDIGNAVMSMQFQDRVSQRIAHVIETMELLVENVDPESVSFCESEAKDRSDQWLSQIAKSYTMDSERITGGGGELIGAIANSSTDDFDVELF